MSHFFKLQVKHYGDCVRSSLENVFLLVVKRLIQDIQLRNRCLCNGIEWLGEDELQFYDVEQPSTETLFVLRNRIVLKCVWVCFNGEKKKRKKKLSLLLSLIQIYRVGLEE